jgi:DJ-1 family protein
MLHIFLADGFEEIEALTTIDILRRCGLEVQIVSVAGTRLIHGSHDMSIMAETVFRKSEIYKSNGVILPGGMPGARNLLIHEGLRKALLYHHDCKNLIAAICAAPMVLGKHGILKQRRATCYPGFEQELEGAELVNDLVVEDGHIITAKGPRAAAEFAFAIAARFVDATTVARVKADMLFL